VKELRGTATELVPAAIDKCFALLGAIDEYPVWYPDVVRSVEVLERGADGRATVARAKLHVARGPVVKDFDLKLAVSIDPPHTVKLTRVPHEPSDQERFGVTWRLEAANGTRIRLDLDANLDVPRFLPLGGIGDSIAEGFVAAAARALAERRA
jgi:ribosome-associated toxin RatA of RatAB toxin-antitoxin module